MLATAVHILPQGADWTYEFKWDGVRARCEVTDKPVRFYSRRGNEITTAYPELTAAKGGEIACIVGANDNERAPEPQPRRR